MWYVKLENVFIDGVLKIFYVSNVQFESANLTNADFSNADLTYALFVNTNLTGANLSGADLKCINHEICE